MLPFPVVDMVHIVSRQGLGRDVCSKPADVLNEELHNTVKASLRKKDQTI